MRGRGGKRDLVFNHYIVNAVIIYNAEFSAEKEQAGFQMTSMSNFIFYLSFPDTVTDQSKMK